MGSWIKISEEEAVLAATAGKMIRHKPAGYELHVEDEVGLQPTPVEVMVSTPVNQLADWVEAVDDPEAVRAAMQVDTRSTAIDIYAAYLAEVDYEQG